MKIVIVITKADLAGAQNHVLELVKGLLRKHEFVVIVGRPGYLTNRLAKMGVETIVIESMRGQVSLLADIKSLFSIIGHLKEISPDLVHAHSSKAGILARIAARMLRIPVIYTAHGWPFSPGNPWLKRSLSRVAERVAAMISNKVITVSGYDEQLADQAGITKSCEVVTIHNGISDNHGIFGAKQKNEQLLIVSLVRFTKQKNLRCLIEALADVRSEYHAVIAGTGGEYEKICELVQHLQLESKVELPGEVEESENLLKNADLFVMSSDWEGLPIAGIEAMRAGLPIVATDVGGMSELVEHGQNGYLVDRGDSDSLADMIEKLMTNSETRRSMGDVSRERFEEMFMAEKMVLSTDRLYSLFAVDPV